MFATNHGNERKSGRGGLQREAGKTAREALDAGWSQGASSDSVDEGDCIVLGDADLLDVKPLG
ncbi:MAG: hypothetical protein JWN44_662 [Myxococcales bacterium]|nr:hypothetical protein [Myxococcales bacterium]